MHIDDTIGMVLKGKPQNRILSIEPDHTVYEALEIMAENDIGALLVCSGDCPGGTVLGILSERDYARKCALVGHTSKETRVDQIMTTPVRSVTPQHTVDECMALMTGHRFRHLPVLDRDRLVGLISIGDLVKWVISSQQQAIGALEGYITGGYPS
ncbi:MAG TPA: CBS domain-containing protein [Terracidiphilus sp.]|jgi:CBS domain-containing protein|nr:CBS domain-containing protein [Terracidiphilus sp.]